MWNLPATGAFTVSPSENGKVKSITPFLRCALDTPIITSRVFAEYCHGGQFLRGLGGGAQEV